jgi:hypothetical protein
MSKSDASPALFKSDVAEAKGDPPPPPDFQVYSGREIKTADLAKEDIKYEQEKRGTYVEFPNGVHVDMLKERTTTVTVDGEKPTTHVHPAEVRIEGAKEQPEGSGKYVDAKGHQVAKQMEDGSVRVWTGKGGGVYNVYPDGHVTKETAAWNREKNTWDIIDDKNTLGDPMRKQMDKP